QEPSRPALLDAGPDESTDSQACALAVVGARCGRDPDRGDQSTSLLLQQYPAAILLGFELLIEGRFRRARRRHHVVHRAVVKTVLDEEVQGSIQQALPARFTSQLERWRRGAHSAEPTPPESGR